MARGQSLLSRRFRSTHADSKAGDDMEKGQTPNSDTSNQPRNHSNNVSWDERISHFTWAWFTFPMSTGGIALILAQTPHRFPGLTTIGKIIYIYDLVIFLLLTGCITTRFVRKPGSLARSLLHPTEALFFPTFFLAIVVILLGAQAYGWPATGPWFNSAEFVLFWVYCAVTVCVAVGMYFSLFQARPQSLTIQSMTPGWILPIFPVMLCGTLAGSIGPHQSKDNAETILVAGLAFQGLGWMVSFMMFAILIHRLMQYGLPAPNLRPGLFIAVGPPSFTAIALITITSAFPPDFHYFATQPPSVLPTIQSLATLVAIFLCGLAFWLFCVALVSTLAGIRKMSFHLIWYGLIFPNVGFTLATIHSGQQLESQGILWVSSGMTIVLVAVWLFVMGMHAEAIWRRRILMPGADEDKDEYKEDERRHDVPVVPSRWHSPIRRASTK